MEKLLLVAKDGFINAIIDSLGDEKDSYELGVVTVNNGTLLTVKDTNVVGTFDDLERLYNEGYKKMFVAIDSGDRNDIYYRAKKIGYQFINIVDKSSSLSKSVVLGKGIYIGKNVVIDHDVELADNCLVNTASVIGYETKICSNTIISTASVIGNNVCIEEGCQIAARSVIGDEARVGANTQTTICEVIES